MKLPLQSLLPRGIGAQIAVLLVISVVAIHGIVLAVFLSAGFWQDGGGDGHAPFGGQHTLDEIAVVARLLDGAHSPADRAIIAADVSRSFPDVEIGNATRSGIPAKEGRDPEVDRLHRMLGIRFAVGAVDEPAGTNVSGRRMAVWLPDGTSIAEKSARSRDFPLSMIIAGPWSTTLLFVLLSMTLIGLWTAYALTAPLRAFAEEAEGFSLDTEPAPLPERGPREIRTALRAFNHMRSRIKRMADDRARMLAAVGHDLRTPITRLRLRSEFIADPAERDHMLRDLDQMNAMVESAISFLRGTHVSAMAKVDLPSLLQTLCDQYADMGKQVVYEGPARFAAPAMTEELTRAVSNLIDNAIRYGTQAIVRLVAGQGEVAIEVEDDGPGIADADKASMLEPFVRGDAARTGRDRSGFGLGLSIARAAAEAHGGRITMTDRAPHGLIVGIVWPTAAEVEASA